MPIVTDKRKFTFEFPYEWEGEDGQKLIFPIKYLYGTYGPTVQIFFGEGEGVELPADIFGELAKFLVEQGILAPPMGAMPSMPNIPAMGGKPMAPPLLKGGVGFSGNASNLRPPSTNPFMPPTTAMSQMINPLAPRTEANHQSEMMEIPSISNEQIIAEREAAQKKASQNPINKFKRGHLEGQYEPPVESMSRRATRTASEIEESE